LEYQNKCLVGLIEDQKRLIVEKDSEIQNLGRKNNILLSEFNKICSSLVYLKNSTSHFLNQYNVNLNLNLNVGYNLPLDILTNLLKNIENNNLANEEDPLNQVLKTIQTSIEELVSTLVKLINKEYSVNGNDDKIIELQNNLAVFMKERGTYEEELNKAKLTCAQLEEEIRQSKLEKIDLNEKIKRLMIRVQSHPFMPVIGYEKFLDKIEAHNCVCNLCANEMRKSETPKRENQEQLDTAALTKQEYDAVNQSEIDGLKASNEKLLGCIEKLKLELEVTEERFINSKTFQYLVSQAESLYNQLDGLKDSNAELQRQRIELLKEKENELKAYEIKVYEIITKYEERILEISALNEASRLKIEAMENKIEGLMGLIKAKDTLDIKKLVTEYEEEKQKLNKKYEACRLEKEEFSRKCLELTEQIELYDGRVLRLTQEVEKLKISLSKHENVQFSNDGTFIANNEKFSQQEREEFKRNLNSKKEIIAKLEAKVKKCKQDLANELKNNENLLNEAVLTEAYIEQLKTKENTLKVEMKELRETMAKMTSEKSKDNLTVKLLNEQKELLEAKLKEQETQIENYLELNKKLEHDISVLNYIKKKEENQEKLKLDENEGLRKDLTKAHKTIEEYRLQAEQTNQALAKSLENSAKYLTNYEQLKVKFENLCKLKNVSSESQMTSEEVEKELKFLQIENRNFKVDF
jgi:DNA repair exonuclease SbcCD ATPase subunit